MVSAIPRQQYYTQNIRKHMNFHVPFYLRKQNFVYYNSQNKCEFRSEYFFAKG